jgi:glycosyltransferase involved in cell wall biosynthesis
VFGSFGPDGSYSLQGRLAASFTRAMSRLAAEVIVVSERVGRRLPRSDYHIIPSGVDLERFHPIPSEVARKTVGWPSGIPIALFVSVDPSHHVKRLPLARAAVDLARRELAIELRVISGESADRMPWYMNAADVLLLTSSHEGSPNVVKEALACNLPVVSVDVGDVRERLAGVVPGGVVDATPEALAMALRAVGARPVRSNGRDAVADLAEPKLIDRVIDVYRRALGRSRGLENP